MTAALELTGGISRGVFTPTRRRVEAHGLVRRQARAEAPPRVDYSLTPLGATLIDPIHVPAEQGAGGRRGGSRRRFLADVHPDVVEAAVELVVVGADALAAQAERLGRRDGQGGRDGGAALQLIVDVDGQGGAGAAALDRVPLADVNPRKV